MKYEITPRGFGIVRFCDSYNVECSLQDSSSAERPKIWLGVDNPKSQYVVDGKVYTNPATDGVNINGRMHLTQDDVKTLLPYLIEFAINGTINPSDTALHLSNLIETNCNSQ